MATTADKPRVDTKRVAHRRAVHFRNAQQLLADAARLVEAEGRGALVPLGNWALGQALGHVAAFVGYGYDGYPPGMPSPPWIVRIVLPLFKKRFLRKMPAGFNLPQVEGGTFGIEKISSAEGFDKLRAAFLRLEAEPLYKPNPLLGSFTPDDWQQMHLRHAELHLSFFVIRP